MSTLKTQGELVSNIWGLLGDPQWQNYVRAWDRARLGSALLSSVVVSAATVLAILALAAPAGSTPWRGSASASRRPSCCCSC